MLYIFMAGAVGPVPAVNASHLNVIFVDFKVLANDGEQF